GHPAGLVSRFTAAALGVPYAGTTGRLAVHKTEGEAEMLLLDEHGQQKRTRPLPVAVTIEAGLPLRPFTVAGHLAALNEAVETVRWPKKITARSVVWREGSPPDGATAVEEPPHSLT